MMNDPIEEFLDDLNETLFPDNYIYRENFDALLNTHNLMIAPINDPTNLFGILEDSL